ncbi:lipoprotein [Loktanella sp. SALINAS62]|nr:lipoprotein [Loktanella sp. SALINAS62]MBS1301887.1 lipoprotein [Loktanella sp. SALINAS62]
MKKITLTAIALATLAACAQHDTMAMEPMATQPMVIAEPTMNKL